MKQKHTSYTIAVLVATTLLVGVSLISLSFILLFGALALAFYPSITLIVILAHIAIIVTGLIFFITLYKANKKIFLWINIFFFTLLFLTLAQLIIGLLNYNYEYSDYKENKAMGVNYVNIEDSYFTNIIFQEIAKFIVKTSVLITVWITFKKHLIMCENEKKLVFT